MSEAPDCLSVLCLNRRYTRSLLPHSLPKCVKTLYVLETTAIRSLQKCLRQHWDIDLLL
jgi:hypothetical protein